MIGKSKLIDATSEAIKTPVNIRLTQYAVRLSRKDLRLLVGLLTGHNTLNRHLTLLRRMDDPLCPLCGEEEDTSLHLLGNCCAIAEKRYEYSLEGIS